MTQRFSNNARSRLVGALSNSATSFTIEVGTADLFPVANTVNWLTPLDWFKATIQNSLGQVEIVRVGVRALGSGVFSNVLRAQDGTSAIAFDAGSIVGIRITAQDVENALAGNLEQLQVEGPAVVEGPTTLNGPATIGGKLTHNGIDTRPVPVRGIIMWSGTIDEIEDGWQLCDGTNGTPDLRDMFVIGARADNAGAARTNVTGAPTQSGGSKDAVVVAHTHTGTTGIESAPHTHPVAVNSTVLEGSFSHRQSGPVAASGIASLGGITTQFDGGGGYGGSPTVNLNATHGHSASMGNPSANHNHAFTTASTGEVGTNNNLPPYYALAFIQCMPYPA